MSERIRRPVLRYHGGKWRIAPWVISHFPEHKVYVEPFSGAASVLMRKPRSFAEVINDLDGEVINVFRVLRDAKAAERLRRQIVLTPWSRAEFRLSLERADCPIERARRMISRSFMAFGTTCRRQASTGFRAKVYTGKRNGGFGDWLTYPSQIGLFAERLSGVVIGAQDGPDTLFYVDPPYPISTREGSMRWSSRSDRAYAHELTDDDHRDLARVLHAAKGKVVISGYPCPLYDEELYPNWERHSREARADHAAKRTEVIWIKP